MGEGGGIYAFASIEQIADCQITGNKANTSGGGIYIAGKQKDANYPLIFNCLIANNKSGRDGGGVSANWFTTTKIQNCTITGNYVTDTNGQGGGLYGSYGSDTQVKDTIIWLNISVSGSQIAVGSGDEAYPLPADVNVTYSNVDLRTRAGIDAINFNEPDAGSSSTTGVLVDSQTINNEIASSGSAKVIVSLDEPTGQTDWSSPASVNALRSEIATRQAQVLSTLNTSEFTLKHQLANVAAFSGRVTQAGLNKLLANSAVTHIEPVRTVYPMTAQGIPLMNALNTRGVYNGQGISVAIVDSGVDYTHPRLGGGSFPNNKVIGGYDFGDNDGNPMPGSVAHGTCCAGIAAGSLGTVGDYIGGVAYNAKIYALKVGQGTVDAFNTDATLAAWDWCITHKNDNPANPIKVISNSWGGGVPINDPAVADAYSPAHTTTAQTAVDAGITILAASGNDGSEGQGISWPAAMSNVISVGAVYDAVFVSQACGVPTQPDKVTCYSNTADILDILAPSENAYTTDIVGTGGVPGDYNPYFNGTSAACPYAAGAMAALQSAAKQLTGNYLTPWQVKIVLTITGDSVTDSKVAITKPRVNLGAAIALLMPTVPIYVEAGCTLTGLEPNAGGKWIVSSGSYNIAEDPNFVLGYWGNYYLSQTDTNDPNQTVNSPCVDAGLGSAISNGMYRHTTRTDHVIDIPDSNVDMGYHYTLLSEIVGDFDFDGDVDLEDLALLMFYWLDDNCTFPYWCFDRDFNHDGIVNFTDYALFAENYGLMETTPPKPNPMAWSIRPRSAGLHEITMKATTARDNSGSPVQYYFECVSGGGHNRNWYTDPNYTDTGLTTGVQYGYRVKARDARHNQTGWSFISYAIPMAEGTTPPPSGDTTPPMPNPSQWATYPQAVQGLDANYSPSLWYHRMTAVEATDDASPPVYYYFQCVIGSGTSSDWRENPTYIAGPFISENYAAYRVYTKDALGNVGSPSPTYHILYGLIP